MRIEPEGDPGDDDQHTAGYVDLDEIVGELTLEDEQDLQATVFAWGFRVSSRNWWKIGGKSEEDRREIRGRSPEIRRKIGGKSVENQLARRNNAGHRKIEHRRRPETKVFEGIGSKT